MANLWVTVVSSNPGHGIASIFWGRWPSLACKLSWHVTFTKVNSASHPFGVAKSSTSFGWGKGGKVTSAGWQVTLWDPIYGMWFPVAVRIVYTLKYPVYFLRQYNFKHFRLYSDIITYFTSHCTHPARHYTHISYTPCYLAARSKNPRFHTACPHCSVLQLQRLVTPTCS